MRPADAPAYMVAKKYLSTQLLKLLNTCMCCFHHWDTPSRVFQGFGQFFLNNFLGGAR
jgi:hypothetical protein